MTAVNLCREAVAFRDRCWARDFRDFLCTNGKLWELFFTTFCMFGSSEKRGTLSPNDYQTFRPTGRFDPLFPRRFDLLLKRYEDRDFPWDFLAIFYKIEA